MILPLADCAKGAVTLALLLLLGCSHSAKRRAFNACVDRANESFQAGLATYPERTDRIRACLAEYNH